MSAALLPPSRTCSGPEYFKCFVSAPGVSGLSRFTNGVRSPPPEGSVSARPGFHLLRLIDLEDEARRREHVGRQMAGVGVLKDQLGKGFVFHLGEQMQSVKTLQIVEAVAI